MKRPKRYLFKLLAISVMLMQYLQPVAILAERRIIIYENQPGPYYHKKMMENVPVNTADPEEKGIEENQEAEQETFETNIFPIETEDPVTEATPIPETTPMPQETETPEENEETQIIDTAPVEFREETNEIVLSAEEGYVYEKAVDENASIFYKEDEPEWKQLVISNQTINYEEDGAYSQINLTAAERPSFFSADDPGGWENIENSLKSYFPYSIEDGLIMMSHDTIVTVKPRMNSSGEPSVQENQLIYPMENQVNLRYVIKAGMISEDIMIYSSEAPNTYEYELSIESGRFETGNNEIIVYNDQNEIEMKITAPVAYDASGNETEVIMTYENGRMIVRIDEEWMKSEERVYPIIIDPEYYVAKFWSDKGFDISVGSNHPNVTFGNVDLSWYNWVLPKEKEYEAYLYIGDTPILKDAYSFYSLNTASTQYIDTLTGTYIKDAYLRLRNGNITKDNVITIGKINNTYNIKTATYNNKPSTSNITVLSRTPVTAGQYEVRLDITRYISELVVNGAENNGMMFYFEDQSGSAQFPSHEYDAIPDTGTDTLPMIHVTYLEESEVTMSNCEDFTFNVRSFVISKPDTGVLTMRSLGFDGVSPVGSQVHVNIMDSTESVYTGKIYASWSTYRYPAYSYVEGVQSYNHLKVSNYQGGTVTSSLETDKLYTVTLQAKMGSDVSSIKSTTFQIAEITDVTTASAVSFYYGIDTEVFMQDNNMTDELLVPGNTVFIREPKYNQGKAFIAEDLSINNSLKINAALRGRNISTELGMEMVNLNTGSYTLETNDLSFNLFKDEFVFKRFYNSSAANVLSEFGAGWNFTGNYAVAKGEGNATVLMEDGTRYLFIKDNQTGKYSCESTDLIQLTEINGLFTLISAEKTISFNEKGKVSKITDKEGRETRYTYQADGYELDHILFPDGNKLSFVYERGLVTRVYFGDESDADYVSYEYDVGNLVSFTDLKAIKTEYHYDDDRNLESWNYAGENAVITNKYDQERRVIEQRDQEDHVTCFEYETEATTTIYPLKNKKKVYFDANRNTTKIEYLSKQDVVLETEHRTYEKGKLKSETLMNGVVHEYNYDALGNLIEQITKDTTGVVSSKIEYKYENNALPYHLTKKIQIIGESTVYSTETYEYNSNGTLLRKTDAEGNVTEYEYDEAYRQVIKETCKKKNDSSYPDRITTYTLADQGKVTRKTNPDNTFRSYEYNEFGFLSKETDEFGHSTQYRHDERNQIEEEILPISGDKNKYHYVYDKAGRVSMKTSPLGGSTAYVYNSHGNVLSESETYNETYIADGESVELVTTTIYTYDSNQNLLSVMEPSGLKTEMEYDDLNRKNKQTMIQTVELKSVTSTYVYDSNGIKTETNNRNQTRTYDYDSLGRVKKITDFDGKNVVYEYDALNRLVKETDKKGIETRYEYNKNNQLTKTTTPRTVTENHYNEFGELVKKEVTNVPLDQSDEPIETKTWNYVYDSMGNRISEIDPEGYEVLYEYTANRLDNKTDGCKITQGTESECRNTEYLYDGLGNITQETTRKITINGTDKSYSDSIVLKWTYDALGNIVSETDGNGNVTSYDYSIRGDLLRKTHPKNKSDIKVVTSYEVDEAGNTVKITTPQDVISYFDYDEYGNVIAEKMSDRVIKKYNYDEDLNLVSETIHGITTNYEYDIDNFLVKKTEETGLITEYQRDAYHRITETFISNITSGQSVYNDVQWDTFRYDDYDQLITYIDRYQVVTNNSYDSWGNIIKKTTHHLIEEFKYDKNNRQILMRDNLPDGGNEISYEYDAFGNVKKKTINGEEAYNEYDVHGRLIKQTDTLLRETHYVYDGNSNVIQKVNGEGNLYLYKYDHENRLSSESTVDCVSEFDPENDEADVLKEYVYDADGRLIEEIDGYGEVKKYEYNEFNQVVYEYDEENKMIYRFYDEFGNVKKMTQGGENTKTVFEANYNGINQMTEFKDGEGNVTQYRYDTFGNIKEIIDPFGKSETMIYNKLNQLQKITDKTGMITTYIYTPIGNFVSMESKGADVGTSYWYDDYFRMIKEVDPYSNETIYGYDRQNNLIKVTDAKGNEISYDHNSENQMIEEIAANGLVTEYVYDEAGRLKQVIKNSSRTETLEYDARGNVTKRIDGNNNETIYTYDLNNRLTSVTDGSGKTVTYKYDKVGNQTKVIQGDHYTETVYDDWYNVKQIKDNGQVRLTYEYDDANRLITVQDAEGYRVTYILDVLGNIDKVQYKNGTQIREIDYSYDDAGRVTSIKDTDGKSDSYTYDEFGNLKKHVQKDGTVINRTYDFNMNLKTEGATEFDYNELDQLVLMSDANGSTEFSYDETGNVTKTVRKNLSGQKLYEVNYLYNIYGEIETITYPDGTVQSYTYDDNGNIKTAVSKGITVEYTYDGANRVIAEDFSNGKIVIKNYDNKGNLAEQTTTINGVEKSYYAYSYNERNSLVNETRRIEGITTTLTHEYNLNDELTKTISTVNGTTTTTEYAYTLEGNAVIAVNGTALSSTEHNQLNQVTKFNDGQTVTTMTYDVRGNRITETSGLNQTKEYEYDAFNQLIKVTEADGTIIGYSYDGLGNRISETITSGSDITSITYVNDYTKQNVEVLSKVTNGSTENYYYGNNRLYSDTKVFSYDGLDNVNMTLSLTGSILKKYEYSDYGQRNLDSKTEIINNEYGYNGEAHTVDGLQYLRARYYDPKTMSFISADSYRGEIKDPLSQNRYTYCHNNPYKYDDPSGQIRRDTTVENKVDEGSPIRSGLLKDSQPKNTSSNAKTNTSQNTNYNVSTALRESEKTPSVQANAVMFDDGGDDGENSDDDDIGDKAAVTDNDSLQGDETEEVTGKAESSNVGTETRIETGEKDGGFVEFVYQEVIGELGSQIFENSSKNFDDFATFFATSTGISVPTVAGAKLVYPFKDTLKEMSGVAKYFTEELSKTGANLVKYASSTVIGTAVGTVFEMLDGKDFAEAFSESMIKSALSAGLMMGVVGAAGAIGVAVPTVAVFGVSLITSKVVDYLFDKDIFAIKTISELYGEDINNRIQKFENNLNVVSDIFESIGSKLFY